MFNIQRKLLKTKGATYTPNNRIIFFIVYESDIWSRDLNSDFTLKDCLFGGVKLRKNADPDKYVYIGYGIGFDSLLIHLHYLTIAWVKMSLFLELDMSSSVHFDNLKKRFLNFCFWSNTRIKCYYVNGRSSKFN